MAFGTTACTEFVSRLGNVIDGEQEVALPDLSEQFLCYTIKTATGDPHPTTDGTWLRFSRDALSAAGICLQMLWPYVQTPVGPISGAAPG